MSLTFLYTPTCINPIFVRILGSLLTKIGRPSALSRDVRQGCGQYSCFVSHSNEKRSDHYNTPRRAAEEPMFFTLIGESIAGNLGIERYQRSL